ncbi:hypothetical protein FJY94_00905 [Candidatus Kaiserbacteria bacterium]|nr:hypothetical protein [Candidatus Kaiserbacteria bacterium]
MKKLIATLPRVPDFSSFCTHLALNVSLPMVVVHASDGYKERTLFDVESVERREYPLQHLIRGMLTLDGNRPGEDAGDLPLSYEVTIEFDPAAEMAKVYLTEGYRTTARIVSRHGLGFVPEVNGTERSPRDFGFDHTVISENDVPELCARMAHNLGIRPLDIEPPTFDTV